LLHQSASEEPRSLGRISKDVPAELEKEPDQGRPLVRERMQHWQKDKDFDGLRGEGLAKLSEAERPAWQKLWEAVEAIRQRALPPKTVGNE
jgi:hypothetical protein